MTRRLCFLIKVHEAVRPDGGKGVRRIQGSAKVEHDGQAIPTVAAAILHSVCAEELLDGRKVEFTAYWKKP